MKAHAGNADARRVSELGEFVLIARLQEELGDQREALAMQPAGSRLLCSTAKPDK